MMPKFSRMIFSGLVVLFLFVSCNQPVQPTPSGIVAMQLEKVQETASPTAAIPTSTLPAATLIPPTATSTLPAATNPPTQTPTLAPQATQTSAPIPTATASPTATQPAPTPSGDQAIYIYLIQTKTGGPVACGDSLIKVNLGIWRSGDVAADIQTALSRLLVKKKYIAGLYNPVWLSNMEIASVAFKPYSGTAVVRLTGTYVRTDDHCDDYRVRAQIWSTIRQFPGVKIVDIMLNTSLLGDILAGAK